MEKKDKNQNRIWYIIAIIAFIAGMCFVLPKVISFLSDLIFDAEKRLKKSVDDEEWGPEIVKTSDLEEK